MEDDEKMRYLKYWSDKDPEAMAEYQAFMENKKKNSGEADDTAMAATMDAGSKGAETAVDSKAVSEQDTDAPMSHGAELRKNTGISRKMKERRYFEAKLRIMQNGV